MASGQLKFSLFISAVDKASAVLKGTVAAFGAVAKAGEGLRKAGAAMRIARENVDDFTGRAMAGLQSVLVPAQGVEDALARLAVTAGPALGDVDDALGKMRESALAWSSTHVQSSATYIDTANEMMKAGLGTAAAIQATEAALRVSTATGRESSAIGETLAIVYGQMGDKSADAGAEFARLGDVLARAQQTFSGIDVAALSDPLKDAIPSAKAAGLSVEQVVAVIGQLNAAGIKGGESGAAFAGVLDSLTAASGKLGFAVERTATGGVDLVRTLAGVEAKFGDVSKMTPEMAAQFQEAFGGGFKAVSALLGQTDKLTSGLASVSSSAGAAAQAQARLEGTTSAQMQIATQQVDALKVELAAGLAPAITELIPPFKSVLDAVSGFAKEHPEVTAFVGTIGVMAVAAGSVLGPLLSVGGALASVGGLMLSAAGSAAGWAAAQMTALVPSLIAGASSAWAFAAAMMANPITWIVLAIIALAAVIYIYWEPISAFFIALWDKIKGGFLSAWNAIKGAWDAVVGFFAGIWDEIKGAFQESFVGGVLTVLKYLSPLTWIAKAFNAILPWLIEFGGKVYDALLAAVKALPGLIADAAIWLFDAAVAGFTTLLDYYIGFWSWVWDVFKSGVSLVVDGVLAYFRNLWTGITQVVDLIVGAVRAVVSFFSSGLQNDLARVTGFVDGVWARITSAVDGGVSGVLGLLAEFNPVTLIAKGFDAVAEWLFGFSLLEAGKNIVSTVVDGIVSMANAPAEAMQAVVQKVRNLLPFSPAKAGPLRDLHRVKLVETVAQAVKPAPLVDAMTGVAGAAMGAIASAPVPTFMPVPAPSSSASAMGGASGGAAGDVSVQIYVGAGTSSSVIDELEAWMRNPSNASRLAAAVRRAEAREGRAELA